MNNTFKIQQTLQSIGSEKPIRALLSPQLREEVDALKDSPDIDEKALSELFVRFQRELLEVVLPRLQKEHTELFNKVREQIADLSRAAEEHLNKVSELSERANSVNRDLDAVGDRMNTIAEELDQL